MYENTSANLCHRAYIEGLVSLGHTVDLLTFSKKDISVDTSIILPPINNHYEYDGVSLYEKLSHKKQSVQSYQEKSSYDNIQVKDKKKSITNIIITTIKKNIRSLYGIYNPTISWYRRAKKFRSDEDYDLVISMSYPQVSHLLAKHLVENKQIKTKRWIQIWEDPWSIDLNNSDSYKRSVKAERKLLLSDCEIIYVSPITLQRQQKLFHESKDKMKWFPLPSYYSTDLLEYNFTENHYGYFGDYSVEIRNLKPFYEAAVELGIKLIICGSSNLSLENTANVKIYPRMPLSKLKNFEDDTNILICLFNLHGGQIPGKIYQYASTNKKVIAILDGTDEEKTILKNYFAKYNRFIFCENNKKSIKEIVNKIENNEIDEIKNEPVEFFSPKNILSKIVEG